MKESEAMKKIICFVLILAFCFSPLLAQDHPTAIDEDDLVSINLGLKSIAQGLTIGLAVSGAAAGIGTIVATAAEGIARQPESAETLTNTMNAGIAACVGLALGAITASFLF